MIGQLRHEEGFAHLRRTGEQISAGIEKALNDRLFTLVHCLVQLVHGNRVQIGRVCHALHLQEKFFLRNVLQVIDFRGFSCYNLGSF